MCFTERKKKIMQVWKKNVLNCGELIYLIIIHIQGSGNVVEGTKGISPLKIHTTDTDTRLTPAWRVRYSIQGDKGGHFSIHTDPDTNDGILTVIKVCVLTVGYSVNVIVVTKLSHLEALHFS